VRFVFLEREILGLRKCGFRQNSTPASAISTRYRVGARDLAFRAYGSHLCIIIIPSGTAHGG
jgi:hypothetical protein